MNDQDKTANFELNELLHPAQAFAHPSEVVNDPDLTLNEKRAILASWASDVCAVEATPALRKTPGGSTVTFDDILDALKALDKQCLDATGRVITGPRRFFQWRGRGSGNQGQTLQ